MMHSQHAKDVRSVKGMIYALCLASTAILLSAMKIISLSAEGRSLLSSNLLNGARENRIEKE